MKDYFQISMFKIKIMFYYSKEITAKYYMHWEYVPSLLSNINWNFTLS